jgi:hypothetical protein
VQESAPPPVPPVDVAPMENAIKAMRSVVDEGLGVLKNAKKQLRINLNNANKQVSALQTGILLPLISFFCLGLNS